MTGARDRLAGLSPEKRALLVRRLRERWGGGEEGDAGWPAIVPDPEHRDEPFPLTPLQQAYWVGRGDSFAMGRVATHSYMELEGEGLDLGRLEEGWNRLIARHDMLRARVLPEGLQQILPRVDPYRIPAEDLARSSPEARAARLEAIREEMSHAVPDPARWPLFDLRAAALPGNRLRLFLGVDALIVDAWSVRLLFEEWAAIYDEPALELPGVELSFRDYVLASEALEASERFARAREYWARRAPDLPPAPALPMACAPEALDRIRFVRRTAELGAERWGRLRERAGRAGVTPTAATLAAYADVLALWSAEPRFTLSVPQFNRHPLHPQVDRVVGEFASFSLLEVDRRDDVPFAGRARRHQERLWEDLDHGVYGGVRVLRDLARLRGEAPLMPVVFTSAPQGAEGGGVGAALPEGPWRVVYVNNQSSQVWLDNHLSERAGALICDWDTVDDLFPPGLPEDTLGAFMRHLVRLADEDAWWKRSWAEAAAELLPARHVAVHDRANETAAPIPRERVHDGFFRRAEEAPDEIALIAPEVELTYGELAREATRWAARLREAGVGRGHRVGIVMEKGWEQAVAAYAVLEAGAAYLPLDANDPPTRRAELLRRAGVRAALTQPRLAAGEGWPEGLETLAVGPGDPAAGDPAGGETDRPGPGDPGDVAFVLYTSGSTGEPKAVQIEHRGVVNALAATAAAFDVGPGDRALALTALHHDMSVFDLFGVLGAGGRIVIPEAARRRDPGHWAGLMAAHGVTLWNSVPAMMSMLLAWADEGSGSIPATLRLAFLGGDWIPVTLPDRLRRHVPGVGIVSVGGPTETTLWNIWHRIGQVDPAASGIPYGVPIANTAYHVLSREGAERPLWVPGELCVSGVGVTRGYLDDPEATAARRARHPRTGERVWRTGDLGRRRSDGTIEFLGRDDLQVQLGGHRVELGEIEAQATRFAGAREACVAVREDARGGDRLVAYVVWADGRDEDGLADHLADRLPSHMLPSAIVTLDALPLTRNGKIDRDALPPPDAVENAGSVGAATVPGEPVPAGRDADGRARDVERAVLALIEEVLETAVEPDANLLSYGADSIDMVRIGNRLEERFGSRPPIDEIFRLQTARALAGYYGERPAVGEGPEPAPGDPVAERLASYRVALAPEEREAFKAGRPGTRRDLDGRPAIDLASPLAGGELEGELWHRRTHRRFALRPIPAEAFGGFLAGLGERPVHGVPKRLYASPGGLYPTQAYLHIKPGRVEGMPGGTYYYHPSEHRLIELVRDAALGRDIHVPFVNAPVYDEAAFSIFLIVQLDAIGPSYGERSLHFATLEAGVMAAALEAWAPRWGLGLCQIGDIRFEEIRDLFLLDEGHVFLHSLLGGARAGEGPETQEIAPPDAARERLLEEIRGLSPEEVTRLLEARGEGGE